MLRRSLLTLLLLVSLPAAAQERFITLASTTSAEEAGLLGHIVPLFRQQTGVDVRVLAVGTGRALQLGSRGEADALLVHDRAGEDKFVAEGHGLDRREVMFNDYVVVGPVTDPARIRSVKQAHEAFRLIAKEKQPFVSRDDDSGTHRMELRLWRAAGLGTPTGAWYLRIDRGMQDTLAQVAGLNAYTLTDRATWTKFRYRHILGILFSGDPALLNIYSSILVNPSKGAHIKAEDAKVWHDWLTSEEGRRAIASFGIGGERPFHPTGRKPRS
jgi:tungstate transport system substrate-binding protein